MVEKNLPECGSEVAEQEFWSEHDSTDYVDWAAARPVGLPNLRPSTKTISLRLPADMVDDIKFLADRHDVPYQSLIKAFLAQGIAQELRISRRRAS